MSIDRKNRVYSVYGDAIESSLDKASGMFEGVQPLGLLFGRYHGVFNQVDTLQVNRWVKTEVGTNTEVPTDGSPPTLVLATGANDADGHNLQYSKDGGTTAWEFFRLASGRNIYFEVRLKLSDATQSRVIAGLCIGGDTTLIGGMTDGIYFRKADDAATWTCVTEKDSTETESAAVHTSANDTFVTLGFRVNGTGGVTFYVNNSKVATSTTNLPDDEDLCLSLAVTSGAAAVLTTTIQRIMAFQESV